MKLLYAAIECACLFYSEAHTWAAAQSKYIQSRPGVAIRLWFDFQAFQDEVTDNNNN